MPCRTQRRASACAERRGTAAVCTAAKTIALIQPFSQFENRLTKFDIRVAKTFPVNRLRIQPRLDLYNLFNSNTITSINTTFGPAFRRPLSILDGRFAKIGVQVDF